MLSNGELAVISAVDLSEADRLLGELHGISEVRRRLLLLSRRVGFARGATEYREISAELLDLLDHRWQDPETQALTALELSFIASRTNNKVVLERARIEANRLETSVSMDSDVAAYTARIWLNIGNHTAYEGHWPEASECFERVVCCGHPENWCSRFYAYHHWARMEALLGRYRPDLLEKALSEVPEARRPFGDAATTITRGYIAYQQRRLAEAKMLAVTGREMAQAENSHLQAILGDVLAVRVSLARAEAPDEETVRRLKGAGDRFLFAPFLLARLLKGKGVSVCESVS